MSTTAKTKPTQSKFSWAQAVRDMVVTSMNRGQLPILGTIGVVLLLISRMPEQDISRLVFEIFSALRSGELWAYVAEFGTVGAWFVHAKLMRKMFSEEVERIGREKSAIQGKAARAKFNSSNKK